MTAALDHLVVLAATLDEGVAWCEATLGVTPGPGGQHPLMGTHNRLLRLDGERHPGSYLEIIALDPHAAPPQRARWFDMDDAALRARVARDGPQLIHWVARVPDLAAALDALRAQGLAPGSIIDASRPTPAGLLRWRISVRDDGRRLFDGLLPTLIEWRLDDGVPHPAATLPHAGATLQTLTLSHPQAAALQAAFTALGLALPVQTGTAQMTAALLTPRGYRTLTAKNDLPMTGMP